MINIIKKFNIKADGGRQNPNTNTIIHFLTRQEV
nr:MAG TPA_asm: hypothetical protein [Caudoviricetes sp.]